MSSGEQNVAAYARAQQQPAGTKHTPLLGDFLITRMRSSAYQAGDTTVQSNDSKGLVKRRREVRVRFAA